MSHEAMLSVEEKITSLFQPDTLLSEQYAETFRRKTQLEPEKKLLLAVLEDALTCYQKYILAKDQRGTTLFQEAEEWIMQKDSDWFFSFNNICEVLGFHPDYVRQGLLRWKENKILSQAKVYRLTPKMDNVEEEPSGSQGSGKKLAKAAGR